MRIWWKLTRHIEWWWTNPNTTSALVRVRYEYRGARFTTMTWRFKITSDYRRWKKEDELNNIPACEFNPIADYITLMFGSNSNRRFHYRVHPAQTSARLKIVRHRPYTDRKCMVLGKSYNLEMKKGWSTSSLKQCHNSGSHVTHKM